MSNCYHPLIGVRSLTPNPDTGKYPVRVFKTEMESDVIKAYGKEHIVRLPCGKCVGCRLQYSRQWADRCMLEAQYHKKNIFITLTYNNENLPKPLEGSKINPLRKQDLQKFFKDLRQKIWYEYTINHPRAKYFYNPKKGSKWRSKFKDACPKGYKEYMENTPRIRYYACGEYSPLHSDGSGMRPHFHAIIFNYSPSDLKLFKKDIDNNWLYFTSEEIKKIWPYGFHLITNVTWETCAYTARYIMKKQNGKEKEIYSNLNFPEEFTLMSRRPGIAKQFFVDHPDIVEREYYVPSEKGHITIKSNRYFDKCFDIENPDRYNEIKEKRIDASEVREELVKESTDMSYYARLRAEEENKNASIKSLKRKEVL